METAIIILMLLVATGFLLKLACARPLVMVAVGVVCALFVGLAWPWAADRSRAQIADWLSRPDLMRDTSVLLCLDVAVSMAYCIMAASLRSGSKVKKSTLAAYRLLRLYPGLTVFMVLFFLLVAAIFSFPGCEFSTVAWILAAVVAVAVPALSLGMRWLVPEKELRLEIMFLLNMFIAMLAVVTTVNGTTAVAGVESVEWLPLAGVLLIVAAGAFCGYLLKRRKMNKN
ncbi:MAG: hypothetical protein HDS02_01725 [Bacteroides sp.]|nr:hypothetical protein [Bacteroides sp.]